MRKDGELRDKPHHRDIFCSTACWHALSVGALEPRAVSDQPEMVSSRTNVRLKLCRLSVSLTSIILTCFYSHILSPHFLFASNKIVFEAWCWKYRSPPENIITLSQQSARTSKSMGGNAELLLFFLVAHIKLFFFWMFECSLLTKQPKSPTTVYVILPGYFGFWRTLRWDYMRLRKVGFQWKQIYASLAETVLFSYCYHHIFKEKPSFYLFIYH